MQLRKFVLFNHMLSEEDQARVLHWLKDGTFYRGYLFGVIPFGQYHIERPANGWIVRYRKA